MPTAWREEQEMPFPDVHRGDTEELDSGLERTWAIEDFIERMFLTPTRSQTTHGTFLAFVTGMENENVAPGPSFGVAHRRPL